jgi:MFS family permease
MVDRRLFALVGGLVLAEVMFYAVLTPLLPYYAHHLGLSKSAAGLLSAFYAFGAVLFSVPAGFLVSRIGARQTVIAGVVLLATSSVAFGFLDVVAGLDAARLAQGAGGACLWAGGLAWLMASAEPSRRSEIVGAVLGVGIAGALLGPVLGALATVTSPALVFSIIAGVIALLGLGALWMPAPPPGHANTIGELVSAARRDPRMWAGLWFTTLPAIVFGVLEVLAPLRLSALGAGAAAIGATFLVSAALEATASPLFGRLTDRLGPMPVARAGLAASAALAVLLAIPTAVWPLAVVIIAACVAFGSPWVPASSFLSTGAEARGLSQGIAFALWNLAWAIGQAIGSAGGAGLAEATADGVPYVLMAGACLVTLFATRPAGVRAWRGAAR